MNSNQPSVDNIERMMAVCPDYHGSPADLIADVIHWCEANGRDFEAELERARLYRSFEPKGQQLDGPGGAGERRSVEDRP